MGLRTDVDRAESWTGSPTARHYQGEVALSGNVEESFASKERSRVPEAWLDASGTSVPGTRLPQDPPGRSATRPGTRSSSTSTVRSPRVGPEDHQDAVVHVEQDGSGADIDCGEEGVACASGPGVDALESDQLGVVVDDPANATEIADLADHLVVGIGQLRDADGDPVVVPDAGVQIQAADAGTLPDLLDPGL